MSTLRWMLGLAMAFMAVGAAAQGVAVGEWSVRGGVYKAGNDGRALYCLADKPYIMGEGSVDATVVVKRRLIVAGWAAAGVMVSSGSGDQWVLSLVEGPGHERYTELTEIRQDLVHAQTVGATRLAPVEKGFQGTWEYGKAYRLRLSLTPDRVTGEITEASTGQAVAKQAWILGEMPAVRDGWATLRAEEFDAVFTDVKVAAPAAPPAAGAREYPQGGRGCVGVYLGEDMPGAGKAPKLTELRSMLGRAGLAVAPLTSRDMTDAGALTFPGLRYLAADLRRLPAGALAPLKRWMQQGGVLVSLGAPAFGSMFGSGQAGWTPWEQYTQERLQDFGRDARPILTWSPAEMANWREILGGEAKRPASLSIDGEAPDHQPAASFVVPHFSNGYWSVTRRFDSPPTRAGEQLVCFWAKGDRKTTELSLEITEKDGSRWVAVFPLTPEWRYCVLAPQMFRYWRDNPSKGRGGAGDLVRPENAVGLQWGISSTHTFSVVASADAMEHHVAIGSVSLASAPAMALSGLTSVSRPDMESVSPGYKLFELRGAARWEPTALGKLWGISGQWPAVQGYGAIERPSGEGFSRNHWCRWIPLVKAVDAAGKEIGSPVSLVLSETMPLPRCAWLSVGTKRSEDLARPEIQKAIGKAIERMSSGPLLFEAGADRFLTYTDEPVRAGARVASYGSTAASGQVEIQVVRSDGRPAAPGIRLAVATRPRTIATVKAELAPLPAGDYTVVTTLIVAGRARDFIRHPLTVRARSQELPAAEIVRREGGRLTLGGKPWHPTGVNYWPHNMAGTPADVYRAGWLDPASYQPSVVEADLAQLQSWGCRAIAAVGAQVNWGTSEDTPQLRDLLDFLWRCHRHRVKVILYVKGLDPATGRDDEGALRVVRAVRNHPAIMGYDIAWEPGYDDQRTRYAPQWREWLVQQYGSFDRAETAFGYALPRDAQGNVAPVPSVWLATEGPWRGITAAYRAFMDCQLGIDYRYSAALVRRADPRHLVGFRGATLGADLLPLEQPSVLHFMDWAGPEGYDVPVYGRLSPHERILSLGLCTRMLNYLAGGKPVIWMEFGMPIYPNGTSWNDEMIHFTPAQYKYQADEGRQFWQMQAESGAWGSFVWWYPGAFRVDEGSDCGLVDANNAPRPVAETAKQMWPGFTASETRKADTWLDLTPESNPGGWFGEYMRLRGEYGRLSLHGQIVDMRTSGQTMTSEDCPLTDPAGRPWPAAGPLRYLNSVFERVRIRATGGQWQEIQLPTAPGRSIQVTLPRGKPVEIEAWAANVGEAGWLRRSVKLATGAGDIPLGADTPFQGSGHFTATRVTDALGGTMALRLQVGAESRARFGEILNVELRPDR